MSDELLQKLRDHIAIRELTARYNRAFDDGNAEGYAATFTEDGVLDAGGGNEVQGREALAGAVRSTPYGVVHVTTDAVIEIDRDRATQECSLLVFNRSRDRSPVTFTTTGRYRDSLVRRPEGWLFERRVAMIDADIPT